MLTLVDNDDSLIKLDEDDLHVVFPVDLGPLSIVRYIVNFFALFSRPQFSSSKTYESVPP